jgi:hypothetical protein
MFKVYGVTKDIPESQTQHDHHQSGENHATTHEHLSVEVHDEHEHETDIGQIAVDILDCPSSIIIVAPIA